MLDPGTYEVVQVHIDSIRVGDTVLHEDKLRTVDGRAITYDSFMGRALWGDSYRCGHLPVKKVLI